MSLARIIITTGLLASISAVAFAAEIPDFKKADVNGDKALDATEFKAATAAGVKKTFEELDTDKDGKLSEKEYSVVLDADCE